MPGLSTATRLLCRQCGAGQPLSALPACPACAGALEPEYDLDRASRGLANLRDRPSGIWRYGELLPVDPPPSFGAGIGGTPLLPAPRLGEALGIADLHVKNEGLSHPTCSFKDRPVAIALAAAVRFGFASVAAPSTGNLGNACASLARLAGLEAFVLVPEDLEEAKVAASAVFGGRVIRVRGPYDEARAAAIGLAHSEGWAVVNHTLRPFYGEGSKTIAFEIAERLSRLPDQVVLPIGSGLLLDRVDRGFEEWRGLGLGAGDRPRVFGVQADGCAPVVEALRRGEPRARPVRPRTIARSIAVGDPASAPEALAAIRGSHGGAVGVSDEEVLEGILLLARTEGIFGETACGATVAGARRLVASGDLDRRGKTVLLLTGNGLKTAEALRGRISAPAVLGGAEEIRRALRNGAAGGGPPR